MAKIEVNIQKIEELEQELINLQNAANKLEKESCINQKNKSYYNNGFYVNPGMEKKIRTNEEFLYDFIFWLKQHGIYLDFISSSYQKGMLMRCFSKEESGDNLTPNEKYVLNECIYQSGKIIRK